MDQSSRRTDRKRNRKIWACSECRRRKLQCDREHPACGRCRKAGRSSTCHYAHAPPARQTDTRAHVSSNASDVPSQSAPLAQRGLDPINLTDHPSPGVARLEERLRLLESRTLPGFASHKAGAHIETTSTFGISDHDHNNLSDSLDKAPDGGGRAIINPFRTKFHGGTYPGTLAQSIPGLGIFTRDAFEKYSIIDDVQQEECRAQHDILQAGLHREPTTSANLISLLSSKEDTDKFISAYMDNCNHIYHVIHQSTFENDYNKIWLDSNAVDPRHVIVVLLIKAIVAFSTVQTESLNSAMGSHPHEEAMALIEACQGWLDARVQKYDCVLDFQTSFLTLLARQLSARHYKRTWVNAGNVIRIWMCSGLHRQIDALHNNATALVKEMRKRLWAAAAEFELQSAFEHGMCGGSWPLQSDIEVPSNISDDMLDRGDMTWSTVEYTESSFLSIAGESLRFRHHLNTMLNDPTEVMSFEQSKVYADEIYKYMRAIPEGKTSQSSAVYALLSIILQQYILALHTRQLGRSTSVTERFLCRMIMLETAAKMVEHHKTVIDCGSRIVQALYGNHVRIALSVCLAYVAINPGSDCIISTTFEDRAFRVLDEIIDLAGERIKYLRGCTHQFWLTVAALGLMQSKKDPAAKASHLREAADRFSRPYSHILLEKRTRDDAPPFAVDHLVNLRGLDNNGLSMQGPMDLSIDQWFYQWCSNVPDWSNDFDNYPV